MAKQRCRQKSVKRTKVHDIEQRSISRIRQFGNTYRSIAQRTRRAVSAVHRACKSDDPTNIRKVLQEAIDVLRVRFPRKKVIGNRLIGTYLGVNYRTVCRLILQFEPSRRHKKTRKIETMSEEEEVDNSRRLSQSGVHQGWM
jgi:hypothetical protein